MYAIVKQGGKQYKVAAGEEIVCDRVKGEAGEPFVFEKQLLISDEGDTIVAGEKLEQYSVKAEVVEHFADRKILVFKYRPKKGYRRKNGHRQPKSRVRILAIEKAGAPAKKASAKKAAAPQAEAKADAGTQDESTKE
jgi:large subunit ribosomal protein L21